jgi:hypothetical protein
MTNPVVGDRITFVSYERGSLRLYKSTILGVEHASDDLPTYKVMYDRPEWSSNGDGTGNVLIEVERLGHADYVSVNFTRDGLHFSFQGFCREGREQDVVRSGMEKGALALLGYEQNLLNAKQQFGELRIVV